MRRGEVAHLGLMLAALLLAYLLPFELVVLSYAILGPAHYLTEISWLHDRGYYLPGRSKAAIALGLVALGAVFIASPYWYGVVVFAAFAACAVMTAKSQGSRTLVTLAAAILVTGLLFLHAPFAILGALMPTLIHVALFTLVFMILGAWRAKSGAQFALVGVYLLGIVLILAAPPSEATRIPALQGLAQTSFSDIPKAIGAALGQPNLNFDGRIAGLLSFVYTYHYLNWFIKAEVIRWAEIPRRRLALVVVLSLAATGFYFLNYKMGFTVLLLLSLMHVLLEFPLNTLAIRELGGRLAGLMPRSPVSAPASTSRRRKG